MDTVVVTGATGFLGRAVVRRLLREGARPVAWARDPARARWQLGADVTIVPATDDALRSAVATASGVVNLAGEAILPRRWTTARKRALIASRVDVTRRVAAAIDAAPTPPPLVTASGVGFYGDGPEPVRVGSPAGTGFLADLATAWEAAARCRARTVWLRLGVVLGPEEGALASMAPLFRLGLGGPLGAGIQPVPWIHVDDVAELVVRGLRDLDGPVDAVAGTAPQAELAAAIGDALGRPAMIRAPSLAVRAALGQAASAVLGGQHVVPSLAMRFADLREAVRDCLVGDSVAFGPAVDLPNAAYVRERPPRRLLSQEAVLAGAPAEVVPFFERPENLGLITPPGMDFAGRTAEPRMARGATLEYRVGINGFPVAWRSVIEEYEPGVSFVDAQHTGPYASWWHAHEFAAVAGGTRMTDRVWFASPLGPLGRLADTLYVEPMLRRIFHYRRIAARQRFGLVAVR